MDFDKQVEEIVLRSQNGDRAAFEALFEIYQPRLKYYVRRMDGRGTNADDMLQDIWLTVFKKIHKLKDTKAFAVWLYRIARNKVYSGFKRKERFVSLPQENELPVSGSDEPVFNADDAKKLHRALDELKPYHKEVLTLSFVERMSYESIAGVTGCSIGTVRSRIFYAKQSLRKEMERQNG
ncbi:MAG: sigma-70 family RNA polymerase sigma factor [Sedimentisphaerales bacterium]|nr:sigma-70 family RNA polymerase sigma factor [Sedimentisphaerales bacterium]